MFFVSNFMYNMSACMNDFVIFLWKFFSSSWRGSSSSVDYAKHFFNIELDFCPPSPSSPSSSLWHMQIIKRVSELSSLGDGEDEVKEKSEKREMKNFFLICLFIYAEKKSNWNFPLEKKKSVREEKALKFMELQWRVRKWKGFRYLPYSSSVPHSRSLNNEILSGENFASSFCFTYVRRYAFFCVC